MSLPNECTLSGKVKLYHYTREDRGKKFILNPKIAFKNRSSYSEKEYQRSPVPRVFFYTDLSKSEYGINSGVLYSCVCAGSEIFDLADAQAQWNQNPDAFKAESPISYKIMQKFMKEGSFTAMFNEIKKYYTGVYYMAGSMPVVAVFFNIEVKREKQ